MKKKLLSTLLASALIIAGLPGIVPLERTLAAENNLLTNPGFENGMTGWTDPNGNWWGAVDGKTGENNDTNHMPSEGNYFAWPYAGSPQKNSYIYQDVPVSPAQAGKTVAFSIDTANYDQSPHDKAEVELQFLDSRDAVIQSYLKDRRNPEWATLTFTETIPSGTAKIRVILKAIFYVGYDTDAYYDNASLTISDAAYREVYITERTGKTTASKGDYLFLTASDGQTSSPADYTWTSSYDKYATVNIEGIVTMVDDAKDGVAIYAKNNLTGVQGVYWINSENKTPANIEPSKEPVQSTPTPAPSTAPSSKPSAGPTTDTGSDFWDDTGNYGSEVHDPSLPVPDLKSVENSDKSANLTWTCTGTDDIEGYYVYRSKDGQTWDKIATIDDSQVQDYEDTDIAIGDICGYVIYSFTSGSTSEASVPAYTCFMKKVDLKSVKSTASKKLQVKWSDSNQNTSGYQIRISTTKSFTKTTTAFANASKTNRAKTISRLKGGKKYYVQIRPYLTRKGEKYYSDWSLTKSVKVRK